MQYKSVGEMIDEYYFPLALSMGIREEIFWTLNPRKMKPYLEAHRLKLKEENLKLYWLGAYVYAAVSPNIAKFARRPKKSDLEYLKEPIDFIPKSEREKAIEQAQAEKREMDKFMVWIGAVEKKFPAKE